MAISTPDPFDAYMARKTGRPVAQVTALLDASDAEKGRSNTEAVLSQHSSEWAGWKDGWFYGFYTDRYAIDRAIRVHQIDTGTPVAHLLRNIRRNAEGR